LTLDELLAYAPPALRERVLGAQWDWRDHFAQRETDTSIRGTIDGEPAQVVLDRLLAQEQPEQ
jgi:hypothetical protein